MNGHSNTSAVCGVAVTKLVPLTVLQEALFDAFLKAFEDAGESVRGFSWIGRNQKSAARATEA